MFLRDPLLTVLPVISKPPSSSSTKQTALTAQAALPAVAARKSMLLDVAFVHRAYTDPSFKYSTAARVLPVNASAKRIHPGALSMNRPFILYHYL